MNSDTFVGPPKPITQGIIRSFEKRWGSNSFPNRVFFSLVSETYEYFDSDRCYYAFIQCLKSTVYSPENFL